MPEVKLGGYKCPCGWVGNSRQSLYWHRHNKCLLRGEAPNDAERTDTDNNATKALLAAKEPEPEQSPAPVLKPEKKAVVEAIEKEEEEEEEEPGEYAPYDWVIVPIIIVVFIFAGLVVFREKILEIFSRLRPGRPPAYGVPDYYG